MKRLFCVGLAMILTVLCGCTTAAPVRTLTESDTRTLQVAVNLLNDTSTRTYRTLTAAFSASTGIIITETNSTLTGQAYIDRVINDFAAGNEPDIFYFPVADAATMIENGQVVSLREIRSIYPEYGTNIRDDLLAISLDEESSLWCVPVEASYNALFCNLDLFSELGLTVPTTWGELMAVCASFRKAGIIPITAGFTDASGLWVDQMLLSFGGDDHDILPAKTDEIPSSWYLGLSQLTSMNSSGCFQPGAADSSQNSAKALFLNGEAAMILADNSLALEIKNHDAVEVIAFPCSAPHYGESHIIIGADSGYFISRRAWENPSVREAVMRFAQYITSDGSVLAMCVDGSRFPANHVDQVDPELADSVLGRSVLGLTRTSQSHTSLKERMNEAAWNTLITCPSSILHNTGGLSRIVSHAVTLNLTTDSLE